MAIVTSLSIYPIKSFHGISLNDSLLQTEGLQYDRNWMIVDGNGEFVTQREIEKLAQIQVAVKGSHLILDHSSCAPFELPIAQSQGSTIRVKVWDDICEAFDEGVEVSRWLTSAVGKWNGGELRLVRFSHHVKRPVDPRYMTGDSANTAFSDGYPYLIASTESLLLLNQRIVKGGSNAIPMSRFRPNIVLSSLEPFEEDRIRHVVASNDQYQLTIRKPCQRCKVTTIDQETGLVADPKEPLRTLSKMNSYPDRKGAFFGQNATLTMGENSSIQIGDEVKVLKS